jgi:hypothetical protein
MVPKNGPAAEEDYFDLRPNLLIGRNKFPQYMEL